MAAISTASTIGGIISDILATVPNHSAQKRSVALAAAASEVEVLTKEDYRTAVRRVFDGSQIREMVSEGKRVWPNLNESSIRLVSPEEFTRHWSGLGVEFKLADISSRGGLSLLGFYIRNAPGAKRPLICVNTAHHRAAIGSAFAHEMGHHLTSEMFGPQHEPLMLLYTGYRKHLYDPRELAADVLVSLGIFPREVAIKTLKKTTGSRRSGATDDINLPEMLSFYSGQYGLTMNARLSSGRRIQYLAGMVHYAKLRLALLDKYDV
jgi:hypothetical protein